MPMDANRLWAKSWGKNEDFRESMYLEQHLRDVHAAAGRVLDATADAQLAALGLADPSHGDRLRRCVLLAAAAHDLGKANAHFDGMIRGTRDVRQNPQGLRHEWVTLLMLKHLRAWLLPAVGSELDFAIVEWAIAGHHPAHNHDSPPRSCPAGAGADILFLTGHADFTAILRWLSETFPHDGPIPTFPDGKQHLVGGNNVFIELNSWARNARKLWEKSDDTDKKLVAAVKDCLVAADVAGSALPKEAKDWSWITNSFAARPDPGDLQKIAVHRLRGKSPREFQSKVEASSAPVTFVKAGCGSGKTVAAYMWAAKHYPTHRLFFCYPTTGTTTEGFKDYLFLPESEEGNDTALAAEIRNLGAKLFHSRRDVDFEIILTTGGDSKTADADAALKTDSLDAWATPIVACTVDTVLGIVQNNKRGLFAWPALAQSAFVFDEIHAYDDRLFGALLRFLRDLPGLPALLMTASLPEPRLAALTETLKDGRGLSLSTIAGPDSLETLPRYHKAAVESDDPMPLVKKTLDAGGKVLWVCNTVKRVIAAADAAKVLQPLIYHSRFKYEHRVKQHQKVIEAFKGDGPALAICTQVAEMSLDLSADLLVTDLAPVPAIIQRLGRLNRRAEKRSDPTKPFVVVTPDKHLPYTPADLEVAKTWCAKLAEKDISQRQLAEAWEQNADNPPDLVPSAWLDGGPTTTVTELREASPGITVLMQADVQAVKAMPKSLGRYVIPMPPAPRSLNWREWPKERAIPIAPTGTISYDPNYGAEWNA